MRGFAPVRNFFWGGGAGNLPRPLFYGRGGRGAQPPVGEGSAVHAETEQGHSLFLLWLLCLCHSERSEESRLLPLPATRTGRDAWRRRKSPAACARRGLISGQLRGFARIRAPATARFARSVSQESRRRRS